MKLLNFFQRTLLILILFLSVFKTTKSHAIGEQILTTAATTFGQILPATLANLYVHSDEYLEQNGSRHPLFMNLLTSFSLNFLVSFNTMPNINKKVSLDFDEKSNLPYTVSAFVSLLLHEKMYNNNRPTSLFIYCIAHYLIYQAGSTLGEIYGDIAYKFKMAYKLRDR